MKNGLYMLAAATTALTSATFAGGPTLSLEVQDGSKCVNGIAPVAGQIFVELRMSDLEEAAAGYQAFVQYDTSKLNFVNGKYTQSPFGLPIAVPIAEGPNGVVTLAAGIDVFGGQTPTTDDAVLAVLEFAAKAEDCSVNIDFCTDCGQDNILTDINAQPIDGLNLQSSNKIALDATPPDITQCAPDATVEANASCLAQIPDLTGGVQAMDNCSGDDVTVSQFPSAGTVVGLGTTHVTLTVEDCAGNSSSCQAAVTVIDTTPPAINACPPDRVLKGDNDCETRVPDLTGQLSAKDNCDNSDLLTISQDPPADATIGLGSTTVTVTVTDDFGNSSSCEVKLNVIDSSPPKIAICPQDETIKADGSCGAKLDDLRDKLVAIDNCTISQNFVVAQAPAPGTPLGLGKTTVTITVMDEAGLSDSCDVNVMVIDTTAPEITECPGELDLALDANCRAELPDLTKDVEANDACGDVSITQSKPAGSTILGQGTLVITITVTDEAGNSESCDVAVSTVDKLAPEITQCSSGVKIPADENCEAKVPQMIGGVVAVDNCSDSVTVSQWPLAGSMTGVGVTEVVLTATDDKGNSSTCSVELLVDDQTDPVINCPDNIVAECEGENGRIIEIEVDAKDSCDNDPQINCFEVDDSGAIIGLINPDGHKFPIGRTTVLCQAEDESGNQTQCLFSVSVVDSTPPQVSECPEDRTLEIDGDCQAEVPDLRDELKATDLCDDDLSVNQTPAPGSTLFGQGTFLVTLSVSDSYGNTATSCKATLTVVDKAGPEFTRCSNDVLIKAGDQCTAQIPDLMIGVAAEDNCAANVSISQSPAANTEVGLGKHLVTFTATDDKGNMSTCSVMVSVEDQTDPSIVNCPEDMELKADDNCEVKVPDLTGIVAKDNCDNDLDIVQEPAPGTIISLGKTTVTVTATDDDGNSASCSAQLSVFDSTAPAIECPADVQAKAAADVCSATLDPGTAKATDNCDDELDLQGIRSDGEQLSAPYPLGDTTITWTATDDAGNTSKCTQTISVGDDIAPLITCPDNITTNADPGLCSAELQPGLATARDTCDGNMFIEGARDDGLKLKDPYPAGETTVITWTATDNSGNSSECLQFVTVNDENSLVVDLDLAGVVNEGTLTRCITFMLWNCEGGAPTQVEANIEFTNGSARNALVEIPCGAYNCVTARDRLHTLRRTYLLDTVPGKQYEADFTGANALISGNLNDDGIIDIIDWATFAGQFLQVFGSGDTTCGGPWDPATNPHADLSGNGFVFIEDHTFVSANFRATSDPDCCGGISAATQGVFRISVDDLYARGLGHLTVADLNADGFVDEADMDALANGVQPQPRREFTAERGSWFDNGNWSGNDRPSENTDVEIIGASVLVDRDGAAARNVRLAGKAKLMITDGSLAAESITVLSGSTLQLNDVRSLLQVTDLVIENGATIVWNAGTIEVEGSFTSDDAVVLGVNGEALLSLLDGAVIATPHLLIGQRGEMLADGLVIGNLTNDGLLQPHLLTVDGHYAQGGELAIDLDHSDMVITGDAVLGGILSGSTDAGFQAGDRFSFLQAGSVNGQFDSVELPRARGMQWQVGYGAQHVRIAVVKKAHRSKLGADNIR